MGATTLKILETWEKQPADRQDYDIDYGDWLSGLDDEPAAVAPLEVIVPAGITLVSSSLIGTAAKIWLSGGIANNRYKITTILTTAAGRIKEAEIVIHVKDI
jgi:hypothetical protein